ncbi:MAG: hypothetical protein VW450_08905 [Chloroflexota bacterium]
MAKRRRRPLWLWLLAVGLVVYVATEQLLIASQNSNLVPTVLLHALWHIFAGVNQGSFLTVFGLGILSVAVAGVSFLLLMRQVHRAAQEEQPSDLPQGEALGLA